MGRLFGTDGVRGIANTELTADLAFAIGRAGAFVLTEQAKEKPKIIVGKDTRISGDMLMSAILAGICSVGGNAISVGVVPTPAVAHLTRFYNADAGVVISASHNPMEYNGIKFFNSKGEKLSDEIEERIEAIILDNAVSIENPKGSEVGRITYLESAVNDYIEFAKNTIDCDLKGLKVAIDCANGASFNCAKEVLEGRGATVFVINNSPDGTNINKNCGSTHMEQIKKFTVEMNCDVGLAFDGDADRVLAVDEKGELIDGDKIIAICASHLKKQGKLLNNTIVTTVMSNLGLFIMAKENNINVVQTKVGDRYVLEEMLKSNYELGGEQSGHIIFKKFNTTGDGIVTGLQLLSVLKQNSKKLSELSSVMQTMPQVLKNARVKNENKNQYLNDTEIAEAIICIEQIFDGKGRVLIRPSGTEPLVRVMIEGNDYGIIKEKAEYLSMLIESKLG